MTYILTSTWEKSLLKLRNSTLIIILILFTVFVSCKEKPKTVETPWGSTMTIDGDKIQDDTLSAGNGKATGGSLADIKDNQELIMLTVYGPETYYDYHGHNMGVQYQLCEKFAEHLNVHVRIDVCRDTLEMVQRLRKGEGDIIAVPLSRKYQVGFIPVADNWVVGKNSKDLAIAMRKWYKPTMLAEAKKEEEYQLSVASVTRHVYPWMLSASKGQISSYDMLFRKYASVAMTDWTLLAAQCYQESCFDPKAHSWAGACGLMQIMPSTADYLSLPMSRIYEPEANISSAARYMRELQGNFSDVNDPRERLCFALAAYNGGYWHIRDAMALTKKYGGVWQRWSDVKRYVLLLMQPRYYNDPVVNNGFMRGTETANYVDMIMQRQQQYRIALSTGKKINSTVKISSSTSNIAPVEAVPHRATRQNKWRKE